MQNINNLHTLHSN